MKERFLVRLAGVTVGITASFPQQRQRLGDYVISEDPSTSPSPAFAVEVSDDDLQETLSLLRLTNGEDFSCGESYLEFLAIHAVIAEQMIDHDVLLMHGSTICMDGEAYVFTAPSGTGKSTHARLWREAFGDRVLMVNDDKPLLICKPDGIVACGSPWNGKHHLGENVSKPLKAIAFLERADENSIESVRPEFLFEQLFVQTYRPADPARSAKALTLLSRICDNVAFYRLKCNMNPDAALVSYEGMNPKG